MTQFTSNASREPGGSRSAERKGGQGLDDVHGQAGVGRETAHEAIKQHAVAVALALREGAADNDLVDRLAGDERLKLDRSTLEAVLADRVGFVGTAPHQVEAFCRQVEDVLAVHPGAAGYRPDPIL